MTSFLFSAFVAPVSNSLSGSSSSEVCNGWLLEKLNDASFLWHCSHRLELMFISRNREVLPMGLPCGAAPLPCAEWHVPQYISPFELKGRFIGTVMFFEGLTKVGCRLKFHVIFRESITYPS